MMKKILLIFAILYSHVAFTQPTFQERSELNKGVEYIINKTNKLIRKKKYDESFRWYLLVQMRYPEHHENMNRSIARLLKKTKYYDCGCALSYNYKTQKYYFINENGEYLPKFGTWNYSLPYNNQKGYILAGEHQYSHFLDFQTIHHPYKQSIIDVNGNYISTNSVKYLSTKTEKLYTYAKQFPMEIFFYENLKVLKIHGIDSIPDEIYKLKNLVELDVSRSQITELPDGLWKLKKLRKLNLSGNKLTKVSSKIGILTNLEELLINAKYRHTTKIKMLPNEIGNLKSLKKLYLSGQSITNLPSQIVKLQNLEEIDLSSNKDLQILPIELTKLINLKKIEMTSVKLDSIPNAIGNLLRLEILRLEGNIERIPSTIGKLRNLKILTLSVNNDQKMPFEISNLSRLEVLKLKHNNLIKIPSTIGKLKSLEILHIIKNRHTNDIVTRLPSEIGNLRKLEYLVIRNHHLKEVPSTIRKLKNLKLLDLDSNNISTISFPISKLKKLKELYIFDNNMSKKEIENIYKYLYKHGIKW